LKKQGVLPLTFANPKDYDKIQPSDRIAIMGIQNGGLRPGVTIKGKISHCEGSEDTIELKHTMNENQIGWFLAGSALNAMAKQ
jgi:aconitate hydratase